MGGVEVHDGELPDAHGVFEGFIGGGVFVENLRAALAVGNSLLDVGHGSLEARYLGLGLSHLLLQALDILFPLALLGIAQTRLRLHVLLGCVLTFRR